MGRRFLLLTALAWIATGGSGLRAQVPSGQAEERPSRGRASLSHDPVGRYRVGPEARPPQLPREHAPAALLRVDVFEDSSDWNRIRTLLGASLDPGAGPLLLAVERVRYQESSLNGAVLDQAVAGFAPRVEGLDSLLLDLEAGSIEGVSLVQGGAEAGWQPWQGTRFRARLRHDLFVDRTGPFAWYPYNQAFTSAVLLGAPLEADTGSLRWIQDLGGSFGLVADAFHSRLEDGNRQTDAYLEVHRRFSVDALESLELLPRLSYYRSDFSETGRPYFTPTNLESWGGGLTLRMRREDLRVSADVGGFYMPSGIDDTGYQGRLEAAWDFGPDSSLRLEANYYASPERGIGLYRSGGVVLVLELGF